MLVKNIASYIAANNRGSTTIVMAVVTGIVGVLLFFTIDYNRAIYYRNVTQGALDSGILAGVAKASSDENANNISAIQTEARKVFDINTADISKAASFSDFRVIADGNGVYTAQVVVALKTVMTKTFLSSKLLNAHTVKAAATKSGGDQPTEIVLLLNTSIPMQKKLEDLKNAANSLLDTLYDKKNNVDNLYVSIVPFSDAVFIDNSSVVQWVHGYSHIHSYLTTTAEERNRQRQCLTYHRSVGTPHDNRAVDNAYKPYKFVRYNPFWQSSKWKIYGEIPKYISSSIIRIKQPTPIVERMEYTGNAFNISFIDTVKGGDGLYDKELEVVEINAFTGQRVGEAITIDFGGAEYKNGGFEIITRRDTGGTIGWQWRAQSNEGDMINAAVIPSGVFLNIQQSVIARFSHQIFDDHPSGVGKKSDAGVGIFSFYAGGGTGSNYLAKHFSVPHIRHVPICMTPPMSLYLGKRNEISKALDDLSTDGPTSNSLGLAWGYHLLSPNWRSRLQTIVESSRLSEFQKAELPRDYSASNRKVAVLITDGAPNYGTNDDDDMRAICRNMKNDGIELYTITLGKAPEPLKAILQYECSSSSSHFLESPTEAALKLMFQGLATQHGNGGIKLTQ